MQRNVDNTAIIDMFSVYDPEQTAKNVDSFFKNFKRIARMAGRNPLALKSPALTGMPAGGNGGNHNEEKLVDYVNARDLAPKIFEDVQFALSVISDRSRKIIIGAYIDELSNSKMAERIGYSDKSYVRFKKVALNEFADAFSSAKTTLKIDLHKTDGELV